jgi:hypothetical protein
MKEYSWKSATDTVLRVLTESREFVSGLILNFALIIGVIVFEWSLVEIVVIYIIEVAIISSLFLTVALFTPQPVDDRDGDVWNMEPTPVQPISFLPPIYRRNIKFIGNKAVFTGVLIGILMRTIVFNSEVVSELPFSVGVAIASIVLFQLRRVWRYFIADQSYQNKSPMDAIQFAFAPVTELLFMILYVVVPVTFVVVGTAIALDTEVTSRLVLLLYLVPMGTIRAWIGSLDPQTDDLEISFS